MSHHPQLICAVFSIRPISGSARVGKNNPSKALPLYEQEPPHCRVRRLGEYLRRWQGWVVSGGGAGAMAAAAGGAVISSIVFSDRPTPAA